MRSKFILFFCALGVIGAVVDFIYSAVLPYVLVKEPITLWQISQCVALIFASVACGIYFGLGLTQHPEE